MFTGGRDLAARLNGVLRNPAVATRHLLASGIRLAAGHAVARCAGDPLLDLILAIWRIF